MGGLSILRVPLDKNKQAVWWNLVITVVDKKDNIIVKLKDGSGDSFKEVFYDKNMITNAIPN